MMEPITITMDKETLTGWHFTVRVGAKGDVRTCAVVVDRDYFEKLTDKRVPPQTLVLLSFNFLLERESKEAILTSFNLKEISDYFPEYETKITELIAA